jgi:hypothetical protein
LGRKRKTNYPWAGRPPVDPMQKVGRPVRALVTQPVMEAIEADMENVGLNLSEALRLAMYERLKRQDLITETLYLDATWQSLREKGII